MMIGVMMMMSVDVIVSDVVMGLYDYGDVMILIGSQYDDTVMMTRS